MPLPFNKSLDLKLVKLVRDNPILYNTKHPKYLDFDSREVVWQKIGDSLTRSAVEFAGIQCQINFGDFQEKKHKPGFLENLQEYLPEQYSNSWGVEKKILKAYSQHQEVSELDAKYLYIKTARDLPTYGVTFFLVKERQKDKKKLVPRLLGINAQSILRLDEVTKEILQQWPLTHVKTYHAGKSQTFTLNFGDYSDKEYSVKTQDAYRIREILEGYIDIIRRRMLAKPHADPGESMVICQDNIQTGQSHVIQHVSNNPTKIVSETFVGPTRILPFDQGSQAQQGTKIMTVQQIVVTDHLQNQQQALKGEMPLRGDMPEDCARKLNRMNSNSVKIVTLLTEPTETNIKEAQKIVKTMQEDLPDVEKGVKITADKQAINDAKKMLLDEMQDLNNYMNKLVASTDPGHVNPNNAKDAAESIADLTTQIYFSIDPKTRRRSDMLRRSRKSFKDGEKKEQKVRRESFVAAATAALHTVNTASKALDEEYKGPKLDDAQRKRLEQSLEDRMGKLNAAIALYLTAHSDPQNIDYSAAINSMNAINELMPKLARDAQILGSCRDPAARKELLDDMHKLFNATNKVCGLTGAEDHEKMQEASNTYADIAGKLIFTFARGANAGKENEIIDLAKDAGDKTSLLLVAANELTCQAAGQPAAADVDRAGVRTAGAARDLLACAQLTAPAIHEPHCQSALTAAAEGLSSSVHHMETTWRPLVEDPTRQPMSDQLHGRAIDVIKALERLKDAYGSLGVQEMDDSLPLQERQRLKFINTMAGARNNLQGVEDLWSKSASSTPSDQQKIEAQRRLEQQMAQLNAAVAALAAATADRENPDYTTAELAISTISELMPQIVRDTEIVSSDKDEATRNAMLNNVKALCDASRQMCDGVGYQQGQGEAASNFAAASGKLVFLISPGADKGKQKYIKEQSSTAYDKASELLSQANRLKDQMDPTAAAELDARSARVADAAQALLSVAQVTASSIGEARCQNALTSAIERLRDATDDLNAFCHPHLQQRPELQHLMLKTQQELDNSLNKMLQVCQDVQDGSLDAVSPAQREKQRLKFINSLSDTKNRLDIAEEQLKEPLVCQLMREQDAVLLQRQLCQRLAQLNAAVAALAAATADCDNRDYVSAELAANTISELMPQIIQDSRVVCGTMDDAGQAAMVEDLRALCEASRQLCDTKGDPQGLFDAAAKHSAASGKVVFAISPATNNDKENKVIDLTAAACAKTSDLLSQVQLLAGQLDGASAADLDHRGGRTSDAAQTLLMVAQVIAPSISDPCCQRALVSTVDRLQGLAGDLTNSCRPHLQQRPELQNQMLNTHKELEESLDRLKQACVEDEELYGNLGVAPAQQEKQRLKFISSVSGAKNRLDAAEQQLKEPLVCQLMREQDAAALQRQLCQRLAQLNAAIAALTAATADRENPDYVAADRAVETITELMPQVVQDSRKLCGTKDGAAQNAMVRDIKALCEASREICDNAGQPQGLHDAATKFSAASGKLKFIVSPAVSSADDAQKKQVMDLSMAAYGKTSELLAQAQQLTGKVQDPTAAAELDSCGARTADAAQALLTVAQVAAPTISEPGCSTAVTSAAQQLRNCAQDLTGSYRPHLQQTPELQRQMLNTHHQLDDSLNRLVQACQEIHYGNLGVAPAQQEKQRLKFISSVSGAKNRLNAAEQQLKEPLVCQLMREQDAEALQRQLCQRLAQLNAAVAALAAATADRENPDYVAADRAVETITELMPQVVQESRKLCGTKDGAAQNAMVRDIKALCEASREICDNAGQPQGLNDAAAKFSVASGKLKFIVSPDVSSADDAQKKQVIDLSTAACGKTSELLAQVQQLTEKVQDPTAAAELDSCGARTADAAQALLTVAQVAAPSISEPGCSAAVTSAAQQLRNCAQDLTGSCRPHLQQTPELQQQMSNTHHQLDDSLNRLVQACQERHYGNLGVTPAQQEKQRLKFISSVSGAKNRLDAAERQLKEPLVCQLMREQDAAALQRQLCQRLAQLNAAVAALAAATADRENPDYVAADRAVETITELMPQVVQDSRKLCGTKDGAAQNAMVRDIKALCEASREICDNAGQPQGLNDAAAKFSVASGKLKFIVSPDVSSADDAQKKQVIDLSTAACGKTSELLAQVQQLTEKVQDPTAAAELDSCGARTADAAQALLTVAQVAAPSISEPGCSAAVTAAAQQLRNCAQDLTGSCRPHLQQTPELQQRLSNTHHQLDDSLNRLVQACQEGHHGDSGVAQQEKQRLKFISSVSGAKNRLNAAEQQLKEPLVCQLMGEQDASALQRQLCQRLAQLNAAVAALAAATADRENPDYVAADRAVKTITELMPQVVQNSRALYAGKDDDAQNALAQDLRALCEASKEICDHSIQPQGLNEVAAKFSAASGKLVFLVSPKVDGSQEKQIIDLSAAACGKASELLANVHQLTEKMQDPAAAAAVDSCGAKTADAAGALLTVAQVTGPMISESACGTELVSAAERLRSSAGDLTASCRPHLQHQPELQHQMLNRQHQLDDSLDKLVQACRAVQRLPEPAVSPQQQEQQRIKFVSTVAGAQKQLDAAEKQLKKPLVPPKTKGDISAVPDLKHQLSRRLAQLNAAVAALAAATCDGKNPDYPAAERAVTTITELMPLVVQDARTLASTQDSGDHAAMMKNLAALCEANRAICDSAGQPKKLHEASAKLADASGKLVFLFNPEVPKRPAPGKKPAVPVRDPKHVVAHAVPYAHKTSEATQDFLHMLRSEESQAGDTAKVVTVNAKDSHATRTDEEKCMYKQFSQVVDTAEKELQTAENGLKVLYNAKTITVAGSGISAVDVANREQHMEDTLATAGVEVASLVAANYADKLDYKAAIEPTIALTKSVKSVVDDGSIISGSLYEDARKPFIDDMTGLCEATKGICKAARSDKEKLNDAAIAFGDRSAKLLRVVSSNFNPTLEKEIISRAKAVGDTASRLALEAGNVASNAKDGDSNVQDICAAGAQCVDSAGKLVYTAKLVAPTIHHSTCQDAVVSSADSLSSSLNTFSDTLKPLASAQHPNVQQLTKEFGNLEGLVEELKSDVRGGKLGKRKEVDQLIQLESPLRQMTMQVIETAKDLAEHGELTPELKEEYRQYSNRLTEALRALDLANARYQRALHDKNKRGEMDMAIQDLQMILLQSRPSRAGQGNDNIVDFRYFLQDLEKEAEELQQTANKCEGAAGKRVTDDIKLLCNKINEDAHALLNPVERRGDGITVMTSVDDIMDIEEFGQECDVLVKEINAAIRGIPDQKAKQALRAKALPLTESCNLLRFATNSHISATKSAPFEEVLRDLDNFKTTVLKPIVHDAKTKTKKEKKIYAPPVRTACARRADVMLCAAREAAAGQPQKLCSALTYCAVSATKEMQCEQLQCKQLQCQEIEEPKIISHLNYVVDAVQGVTSSSCRLMSTWDPDHTAVFKPARLLQELQVMECKLAEEKSKEFQLLNAEDIDKLLLCEHHEVEGTPKQLEDKVHQLSTKLSSMSGTIVQSVKKPESLARSLHAAADVAAQLANTARGLKDRKKPVRSQKIEEAAHEMCLATFTLLKTSELVCQDSTHHDSRRKLLEACHHLNDSINKLVRSVTSPSPAARVGQECGEVHRGLQLSRAALCAAPAQACGALPYAHAVDTLHDQRDVLQKLNSDQAMSREEFLKSMHYVASAVNNSAECAAHAAYLLSVSEKDESIGKEGIVDTSKLHKAVKGAQNTCVSVIMAQQEEQIQEEKKILESQVEEIIEGLDDAIKKTKDGELRKMLEDCREDLDFSSKAFYNAVDQNKPMEAIKSLVMNLMDDVADTANLIEHPDLVPTAGEVSDVTRQRCDEVIKNSLALLTNTEELVKQVKTAPEEPEAMKWVMFNKRKDVLDAFEALLKSIKSSGQRANLLEASADDLEGEKKSYVQIQFDTASRWLQKPVTKTEVKSNGQQAVRNLIDMANKVTEDLKGMDKEDMRHLIMETEQLLTECCKKYDHEQYSVLMERVRDLKKGIERGVVTRVVEDFMEAEAPLADLEILADAEKDEKTRKFLLEKKIAELLAHLSRITKTARLIADTDSNTKTANTQLNTCSNQAELLAPMLVKAAQQRVASPNDKAVIENYKSLLARYAESLSKIRDLCDQSVDPMDFVQTAGETMQRMREESTQHNDPMKCAHTSAAITKLANRVIHVGMSSSSARSDPELQKALSVAQQQLTAATPSSDTRASRMPDWKDTTAKILQATEEVECLLGGETIFKKQPEPNQPIYNEALNLHVAIRDWSSRDNEIVAVAKRMAVLMAKLSNFMNNDKQHEVLATSKSIVAESHEVARLAKKLAHECSDHRIKTNLLQTCERIPTISGQLKMLTTVKGFSLGRHGTQEDKEAMDMLVGNAQSLMKSIQDVVKGAASASVKIMSQRGPRIKWVRKNITRERMSLYDM